jgi:hypothetical protein
MNIDLAALPSDVDTLHQLVRDLAARVAMTNQNLPKRKPRSRDSSSSFGGSNARSSDAARNGSMATSLLSD